MRKESLIFLLVGFAVGFGIFYAWTMQRAPDVVSAMPVPLQLRPAGESQVPAPPPMDMAAVQGLQSRIQANPNDFEALVGLGNIHYDQRNWEDASKWYTQALSGREDVNVRTDLGTAYFYLDRYDDALREFNKSLEANPTHAQSMFNIGIVLLHGKNDPEGALRTWERLVETNPNFPQIEIVREQIQALKDSQRR